MQKVGEVRDEAAGVHWFGIQRLAPRERQQPCRQCGRALGAVSGHPNGSFDPLGLRRARKALDLPAHGLQAAENDRQQVVEIMGDPPGELPDRLHFLGLPERVLRLQPLGDRLGDPRFQRGVQLSQLGVRLFRGTTRLQQLTLVSAPVRCIEDGDPDVLDRAIGVAPLLRVDQRWQQATRLADKIERDLVEEPLQP